MMHENMIHVKKFLLVPMISGLLVSLMSFAPARHHHRSSEVQDYSEVTVQDDSILPVIAWFSKRDTMTYWIPNWTYVDIVTGDPITDVN